jgi:hypothetical protein
LKESRPHFKFLADQYDLWFEREKLISQIAQKALKNLLPSLPKPWLALGAGSAACSQTLGIPWVIDPAKNLVQSVSKGRTRGVSGEGEYMPILSHRIGSIFLILTLCLSFKPGLLMRECHRVLMGEGKVVVGFMPRQSPWGKLYMRKREHGHPFYRFARFYSIEEMERLIMHARFAIQGIFSTLFQNPGEVSTLETPMRGYRPQAGFLVLIGEKLG